MKAWLSLWVSNPGLHLCSRTPCWRLVSAVRRPSHSRKSLGFVMTSPRYGSVQPLEASCHGHTASPPRTATTYGSWSRWPRACCPCMFPGSLSSCCWRKMLSGYTSKFLCAWTFLFLNDKSSGLHVYHITAFESKALWDVKANQHPPHGYCCCWICCWPARSSAVAHSAVCCL